VPQLTTQPLRCYRCHRLGCDPAIVVDSPVEKLPLNGRYRTTCASPAVMATCGGHYIRTRSGRAARPTPLGMPVSRSRGTAPRTDFACRSRSPLILSLVLILVPRRQRRLDLPPHAPHALLHGRAFGGLGRSRRQHGGASRLGGLADRALALLGTTDG
jgi:hypothetical protein